MQYDTGDHVAVVPENSPQTVAAAAAALGQEPDQVFRLALPSGNPQQLRSPFPGERAAPSAGCAMFRYVCGLSINSLSSCAHSLPRLLRCISVIGSQFKSGCGADQTSWLGCAGYDCWDTCRPASILNWTPAGSVYAPCRCVSHSSWPELMRAHSPWYTNMTGLIV